MLNGCGLPISEEFKSVFFFLLSTGIFAYLNYHVPKTRREILEILIKGLQRLEYRGYDSAGRRKAKIDLSPSHQHPLFVCVLSLNVFSLLAQENLFHQCNQVAYGIYCVSSLII